MNFCTPMSKFEDNKLSSIRINNGQCLKAMYQYIFILYTNSISSYFTGGAAGLE